MAARFARVLEAEPATPSLLRRALRAWLGELGWPADEAADLVLAVDEAVSNVVDHAYLGATADQHRIVELRAVQVSSPRGRRIRAQVVDTGRWRPAPADVGYRGRGLSIMRTCSASVHIQPMSTGTRVTITSRPVHPLIAHGNHNPAELATPKTRSRADGSRPAHPIDRARPNAAGGWCAQAHLGAGDS